MAKKIYPDLGINQKAHRVIIIIEEFVELIAQHYQK